MLTRLLCLWKSDETWTKGEAKGWAKPLPAECGEILFGFPKVYTQQRRPFNGPPSL